MQQILLRIPVPGTDWVVTLYGYGAMLCLGFLLAILVAARRARRLGQNPDIIYNAALFCFIGGLLGARLFYVIQYGEHFHSVFDLLKVWEGGLTFYGGFLLAVAATLGYLRVARLPMLYWLDVLAPSVALGEAFGRLGCYLNGCCFGDVCTHGWGTVWPAGSIPWQQYADQHLAAMGVTGGWHAAADAATTAGLLASWQPPAIYPTQLLSFANAFLIFLVLHTFFAFKRRHGQVIFGFILLYGISRFFLEWLRADEASVYLLGLPTLLEWVGLHAQAARLPTLTISQNISLVMVPGSVAALWLLAQSRRPEIQGDFVPQAPTVPSAAPKRPKRRKE